MNDFTIILLAFEAGILVGIKVCLEILRLARRQ